MQKSTVTARSLREFYNADPKRLARLSDQARRTVEADSEGRFPKGRVHPEAREDHNKRRRVTYTEGATKQTLIDRTEARQALVAQGLAGKRGPLSKATKQALAQSKG